MGLRISSATASDSGKLPGDSKTSEDKLQMSDVHTRKSGLFGGVRGRYSKVNRESSGSERVSGSGNSKTSVSNDTNGNDRNAKRRSVCKSSNVDCAGEASVHPKPSKSNGDSIVGGKMSFQPRGFEKWKMIDDEASLRSRSSSREKTLEDEFCENSKGAVVMRNEGEKSVKLKNLTSSLPVCLNRDANQGPVIPVARKIAKSVTIDTEWMPSLSRHSSDLSYDERLTSTPKTAGSAKLSKSDPRMQPTRKSESNVRSILKSKTFFSDILLNKKEAPLAKPEKFTPDEPKPAYKASNSTFLRAISGDNNTQENAYDKKSPPSEPLGSMSLQFQPLDHMTDSGQGSSMEKSSAKNSFSITKYKLAMLNSAASSNLPDLDRTSIESLDSGDLMFESDDAFSVQNDSRRISLTSERDRNQSLERDRRQSSSEYKADRRPSSLRRQLVEQKLSLDEVNRKTSECTPINGSDLCKSMNGNAVRELESLVQSHHSAGSGFSSLSLQRQMSDGATTIPTSSNVNFRRQLSLRPSLNHSHSITDEEKIQIAGFTYRHLMQDITTFKTLLLKLKQIIQDNELQSTSLNHSIRSEMNGNVAYDSWSALNNSRGDGSVPTMPIAYSPDCCNYISDTPLAPSVAELLQENSELRCRLNHLQQTADEQKRTIELLQQQMTKYECGIKESGPTKQSSVV